MEIVDNCLYHLPGIAGISSAIAPCGAPPFLQFPSLTRESLEDVMKFILNARNNYLKDCSQGDIISAIDTLARMWLNPKNRWRKEAVEKLVGSSSFSKEVIENGIDDIFASLLKGNLKELVLSEIGDEPILDRFCRKSKRSFLRAFGPSLIFHICSGNIPGIAVRSLVYGLLVKSANFVKVSGDEAVLAPLFVKSLSEKYPKIAESIAVTWWPGGEEAIENMLFDYCDHVVVYGDDETIESVRSRIPLNVKLHPHGHKFSIVIIGKEKFTSNNVTHLSNAIAMDISLYDQKGCFSPQIVYIEKNGEVNPLEFVHALGEALDDLNIKFPEGDISKEEGAKIAQLRSFYSVKVSAIGALPFVLQSKKGAAWTVVLDEDLTPLPPSAHRFVVVKPIDDLLQLSRTLFSCKGKLSTVGFAVEDDREEDIASMLGGLGAFRITPLGQMQTTPMHWHHDGRFNLLDFLHFVEMEQ